MLIGICPRCSDYNVLQVNNLSCGKTIGLCISCSENLNEEELKPKNLSGFALSLIATAQEFADHSELYKLNAVKKQARTAKSNGFISQLELLQVERIFCILHPV